MAGPDHTPPSSSLHLPRWLLYVLILGLYLTLRGYHSRDNDQAYRLPLLLHQQDPALFADDPFVRAFDVFNPHRGYLAVLDVASRPLGLSAGLFGLFVLTFATTCVGFDRLARAVWPECGRSVGLLAIGLALTAKAGNVGTIHLFEAMLLDRLMAFALGWLALAWLVERPGSQGGRAAVMIGLAALVHPSVGVQLALLAGASWVAWAMVPRATGVGFRQALFGVMALGVALVPWFLLYAGQARRLTAGLPPEEFRLLSAELQSPQHMLPHLWRASQWLAFGCYPILALIALGQGKTTGALSVPLLRETSTSEPAPGEAWPGARTRLAIVLGVCLAGLGAAWFAIEVLESLSVTVFQPFRMATVCRGLALVAVSGRVVALWRAGRFVDRARAGLAAVGLMGDEMLVVATAVDLAVSGLGAVRAVLQGKAAAEHPGGTTVMFVVVLSVGVLSLSRHDTASALGMLLAVGAVAIVPRLIRGRTPGWNARRLGWALGLSWLFPIASFLAGSVADPRAPWAAALIERCRFTAVPADDVERLALWCREHTPGSARFIGPPGPKTFRLWSLRSLAFNRAASPYHAVGLADWAERFRAHVGFTGSVSELVREYQRDRHGLERRYQAMSDAERAALAIGQGASYVVAAPPAGPPVARAGGPLELLHVEGRYAIYRVRSRPANAGVRAADLRLD